MRHGLQTTIVVEREKVLVALIVDETRVRECLGRVLARLLDLVEQIAVRARRTQTHHHEHQRQPETYANVHFFILVVLIIRYCEIINASISKNNEKKTRVYINIITFEMLSFRNNNNKQILQ